MEQPNDFVPGVRIESELPTEPYLDVSQMDGIDQSLASTVSSSSDGGTDIKPQIREQFDRKFGGLLERPYFNFTVFSFWTQRIIIRIIFHTL